MIPSFTASGLYKIKVHATNQVGAADAEVTGQATITTMAYANFNITGDVVNTDTGMTDGDGNEIFLSSPEDYGWSLNPTVAYPGLGDQINYTVNPGSVYRFAYWTDPTGTVSETPNFTYTVNSAFPSLTAWVTAAPPIPLTINLAGSKPYDGTSTATGATATITSGSVSGDVIQFAYAPTPSPNAGSYPGLVTATFLNGANDVTWKYAVSYTGAYTINKAPATVTLGNLTQTYDGSPKPVTATTAPSGLTVTLTYNGSTTAPTAAGTYTVVGTVSNINYTGSATGTLTINPAPQTVTINPTAQTIAANASVIFLAAGGQNPYVWGGSASGTGFSQNVTFPTPGTYPVTVQSPAGGNYLASNIATATITVTAPTFTLTTGASGPGSMTAGGTYNPNVWVTLTATPGGTGVFTGWSGDLTGTMNPSAIQMTKNQNVVANFQTKLPQTIAFPPPGNFQTAAGGTNLTATASSGLTVIFTVVSGPGQMTSGVHLQFTGAGTIVIRADQPGDATYLAATPVTQNATVLNPPDTTLDFGGKTSLNTEKHQDANHALPQNP